MVSYSYSEDYGDYQPGNPVPALAELSICVDSDGWYELQKIPGFLALMEYLGREGIPDNSKSPDTAQDTMEAAQNTDHRVSDRFSGILGAIRRGMLCRLQSFRLL